MILTGLMFLLLWFLSKRLTYRGSMILFGGLSLVYIVYGFFMHSPALRTGIYSMITLLLPIYPLPFGRVILGKLDLFYHRNWVGFSAIIHLALMIILSINLSSSNWGINLSFILLATQGLFNCIIKISRWQDELDDQARIDSKYAVEQLLEKRQKST